MHSVLNIFAPTGFELAVVLTPLNLRFVHTSNIKDVKQHAVIVQMRYCVDTYMYVVTVNAVVIRPNHQGASRISHSPIEHCHSRRCNTDRLST